MRCILFVYKRWIFLSCYSVYIKKVTFLKKWFMQETLHTNNVSKILNSQWWPSLSPWYINNPVTVTVVCVVFSIRCDFLLCFALCLRTNEMWIRTYIDMYIFICYMFLDRYLYTCMHKYLHMRCPVKGRILTLFPWILTPKINSSKQFTQLCKPWVKEPLCYSKKSSRVDF